MKATSNHSFNNWREYRLESSSQRRDVHHHGAPLLAIPLLAILTLITLTWYAPTYLDGTTDTKLLNETHQYDYGMVTIHKGLSVSEERLSAVLLCRPNSSSLFRENNTSTLLSNWTTEECLDERQDKKIPNVHVRSVKSLMANESQWVACASQYDQSLLDIRSYKNDTFEPSCPSYPEPGTNEHALLKVPIHNFDSNIFHMMVIRGRPLWCVLDAVTRFAAQAKSKGTKWTVEYQVGPDRHSSRYVERLFYSLSSDNDTIINDESITTTSYELTGNLSLWENSLVVAHGTFRPNTRFSQWFADTSQRVCHQVLAPADYGNGNNATLFEKPKGPFVLLVLRSTKKRKLAGAETGTATEIVLALLDRSLPVYILDSAEASIEEQILLFESATVVIGMHGAGLTNLIWMRPGESVIIEVAASYGWAKYVDKEGRCIVMQEEPENYKKGGYRNLAQRFGVRHELFHPVYASRPADFPWNTIEKYVFYVDANALADLAERVFNDMKGKEH